MGDRFVPPRWDKEESPDTRRIAKYVAHGGR